MGKLEIVLPVQIMQRSTTRVLSRKVAHQKHFSQRRKIEGTWTDAALLANVELLAEVVN